MAAERLYILDTNVLVHDPHALFSFEHAHVGIPITVLEELDQFKGESSARGHSAREVIRVLDMLRERGPLRQGVVLDNGGKLQVLFTPVDMVCTDVLKVDSPDNAILMTGACMKQQGYDVHFVSKDINMRVKADVIGIPAFDYTKNTISREQFYKGWVTIQVPAVQLKKEFPDELFKFAEEYELTINEYVLVESQHNQYNNRLFRYLGNKSFKAVHHPVLKVPVEARNVQQLMALDLLLDDSIKLVTLLGPAGTGKTFLVLVAALQKLLFEEVYTKLLVSRPVIPLGRDIGFLPGDMQEKLHNWMQPVYDNMEFIVHLARAQHNAFIQREDQAEGKPRKGKKGGFGRSPVPSHGIPPLDDLVRHHKISLEAITYMRGRSIPYQYVFIDEVQNLTPHEVKTLISRVGEGSKIILAGDPYQIDSPYLDFSSNGLVVASQRFKGNAIFGTVFLETSERSELSKLAGQLL